MGETLNYRELDDKTFRQKILEDIKKNYANLLTKEDLEILEKGDEASLLTLSLRTRTRYQEMN